MRWSALRLRTKVALGVLLSVVLLVAAFDWNWFRPALERHLSQASQRSVCLGDLHLGLDDSLQPTVRLRGVHIENAPWAASQPMAQAGEVRFTFEWTSVFKDVAQITRLVLIDADIDLERQADGLRNWRLTRPDDRGPARMVVQTLEAHNSRLRFVNHGLDLLIHAHSTPLPEPDGPLTQRIVFEGRFRDAPFAGESLAGPVVSLRGTEEAFALRAQAQSGNTRVAVDGRITNLLQMTQVAARVQVNGSSLSQLGPFAPWSLAPSKPYRAEARVEKNDDVVVIRQLQAKLGDTAFTGRLDYAEPAGRATVRTNLHSAEAWLADFGPLLGLHTGKAVAPTAGTRVFPRSAVSLAPMQKLDGELGLQIDALHLPDLPVLSRLRLAASLDRGVLKLSSLEGNAAGGHLRGQATLDSQTRPAKLMVELNARDLRPQALLPGPADKAALDSRLDGQLKLSARGDSLAAWMGSANGAVTLAMAGGQLSNRADAKLGLNLGKLVRSVVTGDKPVALHCAQLAVDFRDGIGTARSLLLDTEQTHVEGQGQLNLRDEAWSVLLTPEPKGRALLALRSSIQVKGSLRGFAYTLTDRNPAPMREQCAPVRAAAG